MRILRDVTDTIMRLLKTFLCEVQLYRGSLIYQPKPVAENAGSETAERRAANQVPALRDAIHQVREETLTMLNIDLSYV